MKLREALEKIKLELNAYCDDCTLLSRMTEDPPDYTCLRDSLLEIERIVSAALAAPARNCDVGTVEEQSKRVMDFCLRFEDCTKCPVRANWTSQKMKACDLVWAQMAYEAEEERQMKKRRRGKR